MTDKDIHDNQHDIQCNAQHNADTDNDRNMDRNRFRPNSRYFTIVCYGLLFVLGTILIYNFIGNFHSTMKGIQYVIGILSPFIVGGFIAFVLFIAASVSDFLDGYLARKLNLVTTYGKFMDPIADKLLVDSLLIFYALPINQEAFGFVGKTGIPLVFVVIMIARDLVVDAVRMIAMEKNIVIAASWFGKTKTVLQMVAISLVLLNNWPFVSLGWNVNVTNIICALAGIVSLASGIDYLVKSRELFMGDK